LFTATNTSDRTDRVTKPRRFVPPLSRRKRVRAKYLWMARTTYYSLTKKLWLACKINGNSCGHRGKLLWLRQFDRSRPIKARARAGRQKPARSINNSKAFLFSVHSLCSTHPVVAGRHSGTAGGATTHAIRASKSRAPSDGTVANGEQPPAPAILECFV
jgi:hypothetical protein